MLKMSIAIITLILAFGAPVFANDLNNNAFAERGELTPATCVERMIEIKHVIFPRSQYALRNHINSGPCEIFLNFRINEAGNPVFDLKDKADGGVDWGSISEFSPSYCEVSFVESVYKAVRDSHFSELDTSTECRYKFSYIMEP